MNCRDKRKSKILLACFILFCSILVCYSNSFYSPLQFDDYEVLSQERVQGGLPQLFHLFDSNYCTLRAVGFLTFNLNYLIGGNNVLIYHITNLVIHFVNAFLVFLISTHLFKISNCKGKTIPSLIIALLFALSPVQVYGVTYITQRFEILAAFFSLLSLYLFINNYKFLSLLSIMLGCLSKETGIVGLMLVSLYIIFYDQKHFRYIAISGIVGIVFMIFGFYLGNSFKEILQGNIFGKISYAETTDILTEYVKLLYLPHPQALSIDVQYIELKNPMIVYSLFGVFVVGLYALVCKSRLLFFSALSFLACLFIPLILLPVFPTKIVVYRAYLACFPFYLFFVSLLYLYLKGLMLPVFLSVIVCFGVWTYKVNDTFNSPVTLWQEAVEKGPKKLRPRINYAFALHIEGRKEEAKREYQTILTYFSLLKNPTEEEKLCREKVWNNLTLLIQ